MFIPSVAFLLPFDALMMLFLFAPDALTRGILCRAHSLPMLALLLSHHLVPSLVLGQALVEILLMLLQLLLNLIIFPLFPPFSELLFSMQPFLFCRESRSSFDFLYSGGEGLSLGILGVNHLLLSVFLSLAQLVLLSVVLLL